MRFFHSVPIITIWIRLRCGTSDEPFANNGRRENVVDVFIRILHKETYDYSC